MISKFLFLLGRVGPGCWSHLSFEMESSCKSRKKRILTIFPLIFFLFPDKGILPEKCKDTADLLLFFDELFDSVNGSYANKRKFSKLLLQAVKPNSAHHKKWMESKKILKSMKFYKGKTIENVPTLNSWVWTLEGIQILLKN